MQNFSSGLVDVNGRPLSSQNFAAKQKVPPLGRKFGAWGPDTNRPGAQIIPQPTIAQFDLNQLNLDDYEIMRTHPQVNASLSVLSFLLHQSPYEIECDDKKGRDAATEMLHNTWTTLNRTMAQAGWAGFSPGIIEWENDVEGRSVQVNKVIDLRPQECAVNWKDVKGWAPSGRIPPKYKIYDGIKQLGAAWPIPKENTLWYPILMENGDYYGRKLLKAAFTPWYFSILIHLYANRYHERFGEPIPVGRAPFEVQETLKFPNPNPELDDIEVTGREYMLSKLADLRSRGVIVLPSEGVQDSGGKFRYDYDIEFVESQMRGADFDRYLNRLDEEITLSLFTPVLLLRTADVGSYNLGEAHQQTYFSILNAMNADRKLYIDKYLIEPFMKLNFPTNTPVAKIKFRELGTQDKDVVKTVVQAITNSGRATVDLVELGKITGMTFEEVEQTLAEPTTEAVNAATGTKAAAEGAGVAAKKKAAASANSKSYVSDSGMPAFFNTHAVLGRIAERVKPQIENLYAKQNWTGDLNYGYAKQLQSAFQANGITEPVRVVRVFYTALDEWARTTLAMQMYETADDYMEAFVEYVESSWSTHVS